jgi:type II restriction enzyme
MSSRNFSDWLNTFRASINGYGYYTDFKKVYENADALKIEISILGSLIGSKNIESEFEELIIKYPSCIKAIPILLAVRENQIYCQDSNGAVNYNFARKVQSVEQYKYFMRATGLFDMLENHLISNLFDYVTGVEVGLGSNGRKNRGGHQMEDLVESYLKKAKVEYYKEMYLTEIESKWNVNLSAISAGLTSLN